MVNLSTTKSVTLNADCKPDRMHIYMTSWVDDPNGEKETGSDGVEQVEQKIEHSISMHLSLLEVENLIKRLKENLKTCYAYKVEQL
jgi:hypothetical protein